MPTNPTPNPTAADTSRKDDLPETDAEDESARPHDGDHNQGGARPAGIEYQRELGTEQDS